jgi:hypothetical protein
MQVRDPQARLGVLRCPNERLNAAPQPIAAPHPIAAMQAIAALAAIVATGIVRLVVDRPAAGIG